MGAVILSLGGFAALLLAEVLRSGSRNRQAPAALLEVAGYASVAGGMAVQALGAAAAGAGWRLPLRALTAASPFLALLVYSVFLEIPLRRRSGDLYRGGTYALCRHPGLLWFVLAHAALNAVYRSPRLLLISLAMVAGDLALVLAQDTWLFRRRFAGYDAYRHSVPFLLPWPRRS
jgi:protein-S-isoprenylcysteine O-methyltransferase Ste14